MNIAIEYTPIEYTFDGWSWQCDHASTHKDIYEFGSPITAYYEWVTTCDGCGQLYNELTGDWQYEL